MSFNGLTALNGTFWVYSFINTMKILFLKKIFKCQNFVAEKFKFK